MICVSHIAIRLAGCPEALRMSRPHAPHPVPSLSAERADRLRACPPSAREVFPSNDIAKVLKI